MDEFFCSLCATLIEDGASAYGLTAGAIKSESIGFIVDNESDWDLFCSDCMNKIDLALSTIRQNLPVA